MSQYCRNFGFKEELGLEDVCPDADLERALLNGNGVFIYGGCANGNRKEICMYSTEKGKIVVTNPDYMKICERYSAP